MKAMAAESPSQAVTVASALAGPEGRVVVCGSLYVVAEARRLLLDDRT
jgi:folylpolyglutamate synthase/dihydropteroate synthase